MRIIITGASGFAGTHLVEYYRKNRKKVDLICLTYGGFESITDLVPEENILELNLLEKNKVDELINEVEPDAVIHLAALASVGKSFQNPQIVLENNILSTANILESVRNHAKKARVLLIGSADEYGAIDPESVPLSEDTPLRPTSPYAVSKVAVDYLGLQYFLAYNMDIIRLRPFNHIGENQATGFVVSDFAKQIVEAELGKKEVITVGNLSAVRDFTDVKDMVRAYDIALEKCASGEVYNVGSGHGVRIQDLLNKMITQAREEIRVEVDSKLYRPIDTESIIANTEKFEKIPVGEPELRWM